MITLTGFDLPSFKGLLEKFAPLFYAYTPNTKDGTIQLLKSGIRGGRAGRKRLVDAPAALAMVLAYNRTSAQ
jgi:hypothetical protein